MAEREGRGGAVVAPSAAAAPSVRGDFLSELRRRRVFRVLLAYGIASFAVLQIVEPVMHGLHLPEWVLSAAVVALGLGFPIAIGLAWAFDLTPSGVERTPSVGASGRLAGAGSRVWLLLAGLGLLAAAPGLAWYFVWRSGSGEARLGVALAGGALLLAVATLTVRSRRRVAAPIAPIEATPAPASIAVLPFADLSPGQDQGYFCDGIADELLTALSGVAGLRVAARSSSFPFKGRGMDGREIGRALGVATLLEGGVRKAGNRVRVSAQLVNGADGYQLWSETFDRNVDDIFAIQEEIAQAVVRALRPHLGGAAEGRLTRAGTQSTQAYEMYLRGRQFFMSLSENGHRFARQMFKGAIELDPNYAQAHAGLADTAFHMLLWHLDDANASTFRDEGLTASAEALRLDPDLAEAHVSRGNVLSFAGTHEEAESEFQRALTLNPALAHAHYFYARHLFSLGREDEAARQFEEAVRLEPDDYGTLVLLVSVHKGRGDLGAAAAAARRGIVAVERRLRLNPDDVRALYMGGGAEIMFGDRARGMDYLSRALALSPDDFSTLYNVACAYANAGEPGRALDALDRAVGSGRGNRRWIEHDRDFDVLRASPRFQEILARLPP
jgi:adenylate cyclase